MLNPINTGHEYPPNHRDLYLPEKMHYNHQEGPIPLGQLLVRDILLPAQERPIYLDQGI